MYIIIPFFSFQVYVRILLSITGFISSLLNHDGYITGDQLIGQNGALALSKHCLGIMTMFVFGSLVYLTRTRNKIANCVFILSGMIFLFVLNIIRLIAVFLIAQGKDGFHTATLHHKIYNIIIYLSILILWIVWFELFVIKRNKITGNP